MADQSKNKVIYAGPDIKGVGGISSVLQTYSHIIPGFTYLPTNSRYGTLAGMFVFARTLAALPFYRLRGFNIIHAHGASGKSFIRKRTLLRWARLLGFRTVFHCHGGAFDKFCDKAGVASIGKQLNSISSVIVLSDTWKEYFRDTLGCGNVHVIPNICELPSGPVIRKRKADDKPLQFLFMGKICREKGVYDMLGAIAENHDSLKGRMKLSICGNGEVDVLRQRIAELGIGDIVDYGGVISPGQRENTYSNADVFILPSHTEGLPITILEAAARCLPTIATPVGAIPQLIKDGVNGHIVAVGDCNGLAQAMLAYINDHDAAYNEGQSARSSIIPYLPTSILPRLHAIYESLR